MTRPFRYDTDPPFNTKLVGLAMVFLALCLAGSVWAYLILSFRTNELLPNGERIPLETRQPEVGIVMKTLYATDTRYQDERAAQKRQLESWGWVNRQQKIVHMPIDLAMESLVGGYGVSKRGLR